MAAPTYVRVTEIESRGIPAVELYDAIRRVYPTLPHIARMFKVGKISRLIRPLHGMFAKKVVARDKCGMPTQIRLNDKRTLHLGWTPDSSHALDYVRIEFEDSGSEKVAGSIIALAGNAMLHIRLTNHRVYNFRANNFKLLRDKPPIHVDKWLIPLAGIPIHRRTPRSRSRYQVPAETRHVMQQALRRNGARFGLIRSGNGRTPTRRADAPRKAAERPGR